MHRTRTFRRPRQTKMLLSLGMSSMPVSSDALAASLYSWRGAEAHVKVYAVSGVGTSHREVCMK